MPTNGEVWAKNFPELFRKVQGATSHKPLSQPSTRKSRPAPLPLRAPERAGDVLLIWLPLPPEELHPNARVHFQNKARHAKSARNIAATIATMAQFPTPWEAARIDATFYLGRVRDADGLWTWIKNYIDGLQGLVIQNDSRVTLGDIQQATGKASQGRREVELQITNLGTA